MNIIKGISISLGFTLISLFIFSCLLVYTSISEALMGPVLIVITGISILLGSSIGNRKATRNGILNGALVGGGYMLILYLFSSISNDINFILNLQAVIMILSRDYWRYNRRNHRCKYE